MIESTEQAMELNLNSLNDSNTSLHVSSYRKDKEVVQIFLTNSAFKSMKNISNQSTTFDQSKINEINELLLADFDFFYVQSEIPDNDYIEWSPSDDYLIAKRKVFRDQIDLYKTYNSRHPSITQLLVEIMEYLVQREDFPQRDAEILREYFKKSIEKTNYTMYFIKAYTVTNNFYRVLNKHLALYILDYIDLQSYSSLQTKYRLINCLTHIVTLLINQPDIDKYKYTGVTYRALLLKENDLKSYNINSFILNKSFVSTSKNHSVTEMFAKNGHSGGTSDENESRQVSVLLKYTIKQNQTAIDIQNMLMVEDEEEVLILPFSVFQVKNRIQTCSNTSSSVSIEIDLEEYEDDKQIINEQNDEQINEEKPKSE